MNTRSGDTRSDIVRALANMPAALFLSWSDTKARYKRSMLGPFWLTLGTAIGVGRLGFVWSTLFNMDKWNDSVVDCRFLLSPGK